MVKTLQITLVLSLLLLSRAAIDLTKWELFAEDTSKLSFRGQDLSRLVASDATLFGYALRYLDLATQSWTTGGDLTRATTHKFGLFAAEFKSDPFNVLGLKFLSDWIVSLEHSVKEFDVNDDFLWYIDPNNQVIRWRFANSQVTNQGFPGNAKKIEMIPNTFEVYVINDSGDIYRGTGGAGAAWTNIPGKARNLAVTSSWDLYIVSDVAADNGNYVIKRSFGTGWQEIEGIEGVFITFDSNDNLYVITSDSKVYRKKGVVSQFCPRCGSSDFGYCTAGNAQCLNCPPRTSVKTSPLSCVACGANCETCQFDNASKCEVCDAGYLKTSAGKCIPEASCTSPAVPDTTTRTCKGPCDVSTSGGFYYPNDGVCRQNCGKPYPEDPNIFYPRCYPCVQSTCFSCPTDVDFCEVCFTPLYLYDDLGICRSTCIGNSHVDEDGNRHCTI